MSEVRVLESFAPADVAAVRALAEAVEAATGTNPFGELTWAGLAGRGTLADRGLLLPGPDGTAGAYVHVSHHQAGEWQVEVAAVPADERRLGPLLDEALAHVRREGGGHVTLWLHGIGEDGALAGLAAERGFLLERELLEMRVPLPIAEQPDWPDGTTVRSFVVGRDEEAWLAVNNRAFAGHPEQGGWTLDTLRQREQAEWFDPAGFLLAVDEDGLAGFCWTKVHPPEPPAEPVPRGEIYAIAADPDRHGRGLGRALAAAGLASLAERGVTLGMLYVDAANDAAAALYQSLGFRVHRIDRAYGCQVEHSA